MAVNLTGVWNSLKHEILQMRKQQSGRSSTTPRSPIPKTAAPGPPTPRPNMLSSPSPNRRRWKRRPTNPGQRSVPGHHRNPDGRPDDRRRRTRSQRPSGELSHPTARPSRRDRRRRALAVRPRRVLRHRCRPARRRRPSRRLTGPFTSRPSQPALPHRRQTKSAATPRFPRPSDVGPAGRAAAP